MHITKATLYTEYRIRLQYVCLIVLVLYKFRHLCKLFAKLYCSGQHATQKLLLGVPPRELSRRSTVTSCTHVHLGSLNRVPGAHGRTIFAFSSKYSVGDAVFRSLQPVFGICSNSKED